MSAIAIPAPAQALSPNGGIRRRVPRCSVAVPVDVTVLRSGVPDSIPGRSLNVGEGGLAVALAGELHPGDSVGVEFRLPDVGLPLHAKAVVRHQAQLQCGLEFLGLSLEQQAMIRYWVGRAQEKQPEIQSSTIVSSQPSQTHEPEPSPTELSPTEHASLAVRPSSPPSSTQRRAMLHRVLSLALAVFVVVGGLGWWQWYHAWNELESRVPVKDAGSERLPAGVPAAIPSGLLTKIPGSVMEQLVTHKVEPVYPEMARQRNVQGVVVLSAVIGRDGTVVGVRPVSGPDALAPAAVDAVKWWRFQPYRVNGKPVQVETTVAVQFRAGP